MLILKFNDQTINIFDEKVDLFKNIFFSSSSSTDFTNIEKSFYSTAIECFVTIIESEIVKIIERIFFDKISSSNDIFNRLLKTCASTLTKLLISLFQACVEHDYHSLIFRTVNIITLRKNDKSDYITLKAYRSIVLLNIIEKMMKSIMSKKIS